MECRTCRFASRFEKAGEVQCRRHAPKPKVLMGAVEDFSMLVLFPFMLESDWCGEYEISNGARALQAERIKNERLLRLEKRIARDVQTGKHLS